MPGSGWKTAGTGVTTAHPPMAQTGAWVSAPGGCSGGGSWNDVCGTPGRHTEEGVPLAPDLSIWVFASPGPCSPQLDKFPHLAAVPEYKGCRLARRSRTCARLYAQRAIDWDEINPSVQSWIRRSSQLPTVARRPVGEYPLRQAIGAGGHTAGDGRGGTNMTVWFLEIQRKRPQLPGSPTPGRSGSRLRAGRNGATP